MSRSVINKTHPLMTALVTPFDDQDNIDKNALAQLTLDCINTGSDALVLSGTTGEGSALTDEERLVLLGTAQDALSKASKTVPLIMATGTNNLKSTIRKSQQMVEADADGLLIVSPYYVRPSQDGLVAYFKAVAASVPNTPIILYNIPSRTGQPMSPQTIATLAKECPNIIGLKQSLSDLDVLSEIRLLCPEEFIIWSGDDSMTLPMMSLGAIGVISVASHLYGNEIKELISEAAAGNTSAALEKHLALYPKFKALFTHPNPMCVKAELAKLGKIKNNLRLPLVPLQ